MGLGSGSGNPAYRRSQPALFTFAREAGFTRAGHGIIKLEVVNVGLPASGQALVES